MVCIGGQTAVSLSDFLVFVTASALIPIHGFHKKIDVSFYPKDSEVTVTSFTDSNGRDVERKLISTKLPTTSTCALLLKLPRGMKSCDMTSSAPLKDNLKAMLEMAIGSEVGFELE